MPAQEDLPLYRLLRVYIEVAEINHNDAVISCYATDHIVAQVAWMVGIHQDINSCS